MTSADALSALVIQYNWVVTSGDVLAVSAVVKGGRFHLAPCAAELKSDVACTQDLPAEKVG